MAVDFQKYTRREAGKELAAIEAHLRALDDNTVMFCMECLGKHLMHLAELADEGKTFFPADVEWWTKLGAWANSVLDSGEKSAPTIQVARKWMNESRDWRKELQAKYMDAMGQCECVNGLEPCCPGAGQKVA